MNDLEMSFQEIINTVSEWHDHEGLGPEENKLLAVFCAFIDLNTAHALGDESFGIPITIMRIGLEAAFQLGRAAGRDSSPF